MTNTDPVSAETPGVEADPDVTNDADLVKLREMAAHTPEALAAIDSIETWVSGLRKQIRDIQKHNDRLHVRLAQGTDMGSLRGELKKAQQREKRAAHMAECFEKNAQMLTGVVDRVKAERDELRQQRDDRSSALSEAREENQRLTEALERIADRPGWDVVAIARRALSPTPTDSDPEPSRCPTCGSTDPRFRNGFGPANAWNCPNLFHTHTPPSERTT